MKEKKKCHKGAILFAVIILGLIFIGISVISNTLDSYSEGQEVSSWFYPVLLLIATAPLWFGGPVAAIYAIRKSKTLKNG